MNSGGASNLGGGYEFSKDLDVLRGVPIQIWSTKSITARWYARAQLPVSAELREVADNMLAGTIASDLSFDVSEARLFYDRWVYVIPKFSSGQTLSLDDSSKALLGRTHLTGQQTFNSSDVTTQYDAHEINVARVAEMMMFHSLAGGYDYTNLAHRYQQFCDLSGHLAAGRAVLLVPHAPESAELLDDGQPFAGDQDRRWTYYRFVFPVDRSER
jgi:hypothetical protein